MSIQITPEIRRYALGIAIIGERIKKTSEEFGNVGSSPIKYFEDFQTKKDDFIKLVNEFKEQEKTLLNLNAPVELKEEHTKLVKSFKKYVRATEQMISTLDLDVEVDNELYEKGKNLQMEAAKEIFDISNLIVNKLGI